MISSYGPGNLGCIWVQPLPLLIDERKTRISFVKDTIQQGSLMPCPQSSRLVGGRMTCTTPTKVVLRYEYTLSTWVEATWSAVDALARSFGSNVKYGYSCIAVAS
jgi:hypothetical protein